jgi:hypothetical protein
MPVNLSPAAGAAAQFFTNDGVPLAGGLIYTYAAGTTTPQAAYTSSTGGTAWSNPIVLNSAGRVSGGGEIWLTGNLAYKFVLYDSTSVLIATYDQIRGVGDTTELLAFEALLAGSTGSSLVGFLQSGTGAVATTVQTKLRESVSVLDFGAVGNGVTNDTAAIQAAINYAAPLNIPVFFPGGTYIVLPATAQTGAGTYNTALVMLGNMHIIGDHGATIKVADNYSTDASPKELAIFSTVLSIGNVTFEGITFDLNGANNLMSPLRPTTYNSFNHAAILVNGPTGKMNDVWIDKCIFKNTAGVCFVVCQLVAAGTTPLLGVRWKITNNLFLNGGSDSADHTSVYAWAEDVLCDGNTFWEDSPPHTIGKTGGATGYEVHGSNQRFVNNYVYNYTLGAYVAPNFTNTTLNTIVQGNNFYCSDYGILLWRASTLGYLEVSGVLIDSNTFYFDNYTYTGQPLYKAAVAYQGQIATAQGAINNVKISNNYAINTGTTLLSQFVRWDTSTTASQTGSNLSITDNQVVGFTDGFYLVTNVANGIGLTEVSRNQFISLTPDALANPPHGIYVLSNNTGLIKTLVINDNEFVDERATSLMQYGIYFSTGTITDLSLGNQTFKGMSATNAYNAGPMTITNQIGTAAQYGASNVADGGTVNFTGNFAGFTPKAIIATGTVAAEVVSVTTFGASTFTVAIKKVSGAAGTTQTVYWQVKF